MACWLSQAGISASSVPIEVAQGRGSPRKFQSSDGIVAARECDLSFAGRVTNKYSNLGEIEHHGRLLLEVADALLNLGIELVSSLLESGLGHLL